MPAPVDLLTPKYALLMPAVSACIVGFFAAKGYEMSHHARADVMGVTSGLMVFLAERVGWYLSVTYLQSESNPDPTRRNWTALREKLVQEEQTTAQQYESRVRPGNLALGCANGQHQTKTFYFPAGITLQHLIAFGDLIAAGKPPRYRSLKKTFDYQVWSDFRDWMMLEQINKFGIMAEYTSKRDEWDVTPCGRKMAVIWRCQASPTPLLSKSIKYRIYSEQNE